MESSLTWPIVHFKMDGDETKSTTVGVDENYLPGAASLIEEIDKRIMIILRDGRHIVGRLRSFDQYMNLIMEETCERVLMPGKFCDIPLGLYIVRGDTIVLLGETDQDAEEEKMNLKRIEPEEMMEAMVSGAEDSKVSWDFE